MSNEWRRPDETFTESPRLQADLIAHAIGAETRILDFVARLADAWNGRGDVVLTLAERLALAELGGLSHARTKGLNSRWEELTANDRRYLLFAARRAIEFARVCAWVFGEGRGPQQ